jgi:hypothetical protein
LKSLQIFSKMFLKYLPFIIIFLLLGCTKPIETTPIESHTLENAWISENGGAGGYRDYSSFKNFQYEFEVVGENQSIGIELTASDFNITYAIFNSLGEVLEESNVKPTVKDGFKLNGGKYRLVVCAEERQTGKVNLKFVGVKGIPIAIPFKLLRFNAEKFGEFGSGGVNETPKNHFYTFLVLEDNTLIDMESESGDLNVCLNYYNNLREYKDSDRNRKFVSLSKKVNRGEYMVMVGSQNRGDIGSYNLRIFGKVDNLKKIETNSETIKGIWTNANDVKVQEIEIPENNIILDVELTSKDVNVWFEVQNQLGKRVLGDNGTKQGFDYVTLPKGNYKIFFKPNPGSNSGGEYNLNIFGKFIKK